MSSTLLLLRAVCRTSLDSTILCSFCVYAKIQSSVVCRDAFINHRNQLSQFGSQRFGANCRITVGSNTYFQKCKKTRNVGTSLVIRITHNMGICTMTSFDYNYQNPLGFRFLVQITPFVLDIPLGLQNLNKKRKTK